MTEPLVVSEEHRGLPHPIMRQIVNVHVGLALEEEKELQQTARAEHEKELPGMAAKGGYPVDQYRLTVYPRHPPSVRS